jgi:hypothetical protein
LPDWDGLINTYFWYYGTLALFQHQGPQWTRWNEAMTRTLVENQRKDGRTAGSWDPIGEWAPTGGRVYQTAICTLMLEVYYRYLPLYSFEQPETDEPGTLRGLVTDAGTGRPLPGARVQLDRAGQEPLIVAVDAEGRYVLRPAEVPDHFAVSASHPGYTPDSANVAGVDLKIGRARLDFNLQPMSEDIIALEATPDVHHLGNDAFSGAINSQFQKNSEGREFESAFRVTRAQWQQAEMAELSLLAKGVQCPHRIYINGVELEVPLDKAPRDGSFGEFAARFDAGLLQSGQNTIRIRAVSCRGDLDDFEFVNLKIRLLP